MTPEEILISIYNDAVKMVSNYKNANRISENNGILFPVKLSNNINILIDKIDSNKSLLSALVTSCLKKIITPDQDIRLHRTDFENGYSARSLDTSFTAPFFKNHFPKYANKESAFLTMATREKVKWDKTEGINLKIRNKDVKKSFLECLDFVESGEIKPEIVLTYIFYKLFLLSESQKKIFDDTIQTADYTNIININAVLNMLNKHFETKLSSRLPVIAIYTIYEKLINSIKRYEDKKLLLLNVHTSSDKHGYGDVEIWNTDDTPFEIIEIKHNIPIDRNMIFDIVKKSQNTSIVKYYLLTTYHDSFLSEQEEIYVNQFVLKIKKEYCLEIIPNGILTTLKYYLRFIENYNDFIKSYTSNLIRDAKNSTEIKDYHIEEWSKILKIYHFDK